MLAKSLPIIIAVLALLAGYVLYVVFVPLFVPDGRVFVVAKGESFYEIGRNLEREGYVRSGLVFGVYALMTGASKNLQAGHYEFQESVTLPYIVGKMRKGEVAATDREIKIIEGWDIDDIAEYLKKEGVIEELREFLAPVYEFRENSELFTEKSAFLASDLEGAGSLEGFLFPDTYRVPLDAGAKDIIRALLENFAGKIAPLYDEISRNPASLLEVVTMASLLEKEVQTKEDMENVAGVLWKRLRAGYHLQVDATIIYLTGKKTAKIPQQDLEIDSPYNTYKYPGLPPGPIANPGMDAIESALRPKTNPFWFYLSAPNGTTIFSKTFQEHKQAKQKYLK